MSHEILRTVDDYYTGRLREFGPVARGVDWNSEQSQVLRFDQLLKVCEPGPCRLGDFGCGYGALLDHLRRAGSDAEYRGFDISAAMIDSARQTHAAEHPALFSTDESVLDGCDFVVASGIFNVRLKAALDAWQEYVAATIERLARLARKGFAFNMLTSYSDPERMRDDLYYGDPCHWFDHCKRRYSRHVALLHDYGLWEFTILVRSSPIEVR
jgi:SAM-dependent methyltransferase